MIYYINQGFIAELAITDIIRKYLEKLRCDVLYPNFHISVTNNHPFAHLIIHQDSTNIADIFPSVVVTTQNDSKSPEMNNMPPTITAITLQPNDFDKLQQEKRQRTTIDEATGEEIPIYKNGQPVYENIPGFINSAEPEIIEKLKAISKERSLYGIFFENRRHDRISIEIWTENAQLKNELYEHIRLFLETSFLETIQTQYPNNKVVVFDTTINGERSNNFNFDFDVPLFGANITFDIEYSVSQIVVDTNITDITNIVTEVFNNVKEE